MNYQEEVAKALLEIEAVGFRPKDPVTFASGIKSPVYIDNRKFPFWPSQWRIVIEGFKNLIQEKGIGFDIVAGIEAAGIPHSSALGYAMSKPSIFVRKKAKDHGTKSRIEGGKVADKKVLLIEDLVSTGGSSLSGVVALRAEGAIVNDCLVIVSYDFKEARENFEKEKVNLYTLTSFSVILEQALKQNKFSTEEYEIIKDWFSDPHGWAERQGF